MSEPPTADRNPAAHVADLRAPLVDRPPKIARGRGGPEIQPSRLEDGEEPAQTRAQPLVVRLERSDPPDRWAALSAAAAASLLVLADARCVGERVSRGRPGRRRG
ncbi:MAG: hypothetical protein ACR2F6_18140 [Mycobacteriales bacterium]